jgi:hypothetical protein
MLSGGGPERHGLAPINLLIGSGALSQHAARLRSRLGLHIPPCNHNRRGAPILQLYSTPFEIGNIVVTICESDDLIP